MKIILALILVTMTVGSAWAAEAEHADPKLVEKLLVVSHSEKVSQQLQAQVQALLNHRAQQMNATPADRAIMDKYSKELSDVLLPALAWDKLQPDLIHIYSTIFTNKEITDLTRFYESESGQAYLKKSPELNQETLMLMQSRLQALQPKVQDLAHRMDQELQASHAVPPAGPKK